MSDKRLFSQYYSTDTNKYEDKEKFRARIVKYLHDVINEQTPISTQKLCRQIMGITIPAIPNPINIIQLIYGVETQFGNEKTPIKDILDLITVAFDSWESIDEDSLSEIRKKYVHNINSIFTEESMCYVLQNDGCVRYYPDEEFHSLVKSTLSILEYEPYLEQSISFNKILDEIYKERGKETPIRSFFTLIESLVLSITKNRYKQLNAKSIDILHTIMKKKLNNYTINDLEAIDAFKEGLQNWVKMCHKYRHGKSEHVHANVPIDIFDYIFSTGISIYRFLLELNRKYNLDI